MGSGKWMEEEKGNFTLESSLLFPVVILITLAMIFFGMFLYLQFFIYFNAVQASERLAFTWDNSHKSLLTGDYYVGAEDGLYWRTTDDGALDWLGFANAADANKLSFGSKDTLTIGASLIGRKLQRIHAILPPSVSGQTAYYNHWLNRKVSVQLQTLFSAPKPLQSLFPAWVNSGQTSSAVTEPAEFIRLVDIVRTYAPEVKQWIGKQGAQKQNDQNSDEPVRSGETGSDRIQSFDTHDQAKRYLQHLVHGRESHFSTEEYGTWRMVDALDSGGVAHQAYYGTQSYSKEVRGQLAKDLELMRKLQVKGVVWHFFRRKKDDSIGLSAKLRNELERSGIIIVIHDEDGG